MRRLLLLLRSLLGHETCAVCRDCVGCGAARGCQLWCATENRS